MNRRRLDFEAMRDTLLSATDQLDGSQIGGKSENIVEPGVRRRTLYAHVDRQNLPAVFRVFDFASPDTHNPKRPQTTVPQQALFLLNNPFVIDLAERVAQETQTLKHAERVDAIFARIYARRPTGRERAWIADMLAEADRMTAAASLGGWSYGHGKVNADGAVDFQPLRYFESRWSAGPELPDPKLNWVSLTADGGHPGSEGDGDTPLGGARWVDGGQAIDHRLPGAPPAEEGDGVRGRIVSNRHGVLAERTVHHGAGAVHAAVDVSAGDTIDFIVDGIANVNHDSFRWRVTLNGALEPKAEQGSSGLGAATLRTRWDSREDFGGERSKPLDPWAQLAQVMLNSNELLFLD